MDIGKAGPVYKEKTYKISLTQGNANLVCKYVGVGDVFEIIGVGDVFIDKETERMTIPVTMERIKKGPFMEFDKE